MRAFSLACVGVSWLSLVAAPGAIAAPKWLQCSVADDNRGKRDFKLMVDDQNGELQILLGKDNALSAKLATDPFGLRADFGSITLVIDRELGYTHYEHFRYTSKGWITDAVMTGLCRPPGEPSAARF